MLENKKLFLLDIDGTICKGNQLVEGSAAFLKDITANDGQFVFITNNATKSIDDYIRFFSGSWNPHRLHQFPDSILCNH